MSKEIILQLILPLLFLVVMIGSLKYLQIKNKASSTDKIEQFKHLLDTDQQTKASIMLAKAIDDMKATGNGDKAREMFQLASAAKRDKEAQVKKETSPENISSAVIDLLNENESQAIMLYRPYPPSLLEAENSYLGGLPMLPPNVKWPETSVQITASNGESINDISAMHFLGQINLQELPENDSLPETGVLYFFANLSGPAQESNTGAKVIFSKELLAEWTPRQAPDNLPKRWGNPSKASDWRLFPKWPVRFFKTPSFKTEGFSQDFYNEMSNKYPGTYNKDISDWEEGFWDIYHEEITKRSPLPDHVTADIRQKSAVKPKWMEYLTNEDELILPEDFPTSGAMMDEMAKNIIYFVTKKIDDYESSIEYRKADFNRKLKQYEVNTAEGQIDLMKPEYNPPDEVYGRDIIEALHTEALEWQKTALKIGHKNKPNDAQTKAFIDWLKTIGKLKGPKTKTLQGKLYATPIFVSSRVQSAIYDSIKALFQRAIIDTDYIKIIPESYYGDLPHHNLHDSHLTIKHQLLGNPPMRTNPIEIGENDVLLLSLFSDHGVNFLFGDLDQMQFYIDKDDLVAHRFDKAWGRAG